MSRCLKQNLSLTGLKAYITNIYVIERNIAKKTSKCQPMILNGKLLGICCMYKMKSNKYVNDKVFCVLYFCYVTDIFNMIMSIISDIF